MKYLILLIAALTIAELSAQTIDEKFIESADSGLAALSELHRKVKHIHPVLQKLQPVAVVNGEQLYIFDADSADQKYQFIKQETVPFPMDEGIRASFPIAQYEFKPVCVIGKKALESPGGRAVVLHEFVHCAQFNSVEMQIKEKLGIYKEAMESKNYSWELAHPFPYDSLFLPAYREFHSALTKGDLETAKSLRNKIKGMLSKTDFEYLVWQEWKEGFARYIENRIRTEEEIKLNTGGSDYPLDRVVFYYGGELFIKFLTSSKQDITSDLPQLFNTMFNFGAE